MTSKHQIDVSITIARSPSEVWASVEDIESHTEWMKDASAIRITSESQAGEGTQFECDTKIGPFRLVDKMTITSWQVNRVMGVRHQGIVSGWGQFSLEENQSGHTVFRWAESLRFPWYLGGQFGSVIARPILRWVWNGNLRRLKASIEQNDPIAPIEH